MNWHAVWQYVIGGAIVSWPPVLTGYWLTWRKTRAHVDARTAQQTELIAQLTDRQTADLLGSDLLGGARVSRQPGGYHEHEQDSGAGP